MNKMDTQTRRLSLQTKFTDYRNLSGYPRSAFTVAYSPYSPSPATPRYLQREDAHSPLRVDPTRRHGVDDIDPRKRAESPPPYRRKGQEAPSPYPRSGPLSPATYAAKDQEHDHSRMLPPITEHGRPAASRPGWPAPSASLTQARRSAGMPIPRHLSLSAESSRERTIVDETRSLLLTGLHPSHLRSVAAVSTPRDRRLSHPVTPLTARRRSYYAARDLRERRDYLAYGHLEGDPLEADCLVAAFALRRNSRTPSTSEYSDKVKTDGKEEQETVETTCKEQTSKQAEADKKDKSDRVTIRVRVHPRDVHRQTFLMQRSLDIEELRGTIPEPPPTPMTGKPPTSASLAVPQHEDRRKSADMLSPAEAETPGLRNTSRRTSSASDKGKDGGPDTLDRDLFRRAKAVPMHLDIARESLPVLAVLMMTGYIRKGDIIDLPMPHPEVWPQTVAYVYTPERIELTEPIKANILYLGGKVSEVSVAR